MGYGRRSNHGKDCFKSLIRDELKRAQEQTTEDDEPDCVQRRSGDWRHAREDLGQSSIGTKEVDEEVSGEQGDQRVRVCTHAKA